MSNRAPPVPHVANQLVGSGASSPQPCLGAGLAKKSCQVFRSHACSCSHDITSPVTSWTFGWTWTYDRTVPLRLQLNEKLAGGEELGAFDGLLFASLGG